MQKSTEREAVYERLIVDRPSYLILRFVDKFGDECYKDQSTETYKYAIGDMEEIFTEFIFKLIDEQNKYIHDEIYLEEYKQRELSNLRQIMEVIRSREYDAVIKWYTRNCFFYQALNTYMRSKIYYDTFRIRLAAYAVIKGLEILKQKRTSTISMQVSTIQPEITEPVSKIECFEEQVIYEDGQRFSQIIEETYSTAPNSQIPESIVLFRGVGMNTNNFNELLNQKLIFLQMFSSTSRNKDVAKQFALRSIEPIEIIFELETNLKYATNIKEYSQIPGEEEWILNLNIQFNITDIIPIENMQSSYLVKAFVSDIDQEELDYNRLIEGALNRDFNIFIKLIGFFNKDVDIDLIMNKYQFQDQNQQMYIYQQICQTYTKNNQFDKLYSLTGIMMNMITPSTTNHLRIVTYRFYAQALQAYGNFKESQFYLQEAIQLAIQLNDKIQIALAQHFLGILYLNYNELEAAQYILEPSYKLYKEYKSTLKGKKVDVMVVNQYALYLIFMNKYSFDEKRKLIQHLQFTKNNLYGKYSPITAQNQLWNSLLYLYNEDYHRSLQEFNDCFDTIQNAGHNWIDAQILGWYIQGRLFDHRQEYDKSSSLILKALEIINHQPKFGHQLQLLKTNNRHCKAYAYRNLVFNRMTLSILQYFEEYKKVEEEQRNNMNFQPQPLNIFGEIFWNWQLDSISEDADSGYYEQQETNTDQ